MLDEPTSGLDNITANAVMQQIYTLMSGVTTIIISHDLPSLTHVDTIHYLKEGKIIESGSFNELVNKKGEFFKQLSTQCSNAGVNLKNLTQKSSTPLAKTEVSDRIDYRNTDLIQSLHTVNTAGLKTPLLNKRI